MRGGGGLGWMVGRCYCGFDGVPSHDRPKNARGQGSERSQDMSSDPCLAVAVAVAARTHL